MRVFLVLAALVAFACAKDYEGYKLIRVVPTTPDHMAELYDMQQHDTALDFFIEVTGPFRPVDILVPPPRTRQVTIHLENIGMTVEVKNHNVQKQIDEEKERLSQKKAFDYYDWNTFDETIEELEVLKAACPSGFTCDTSVFGQSVEGRDMVVFSIDGPGSEVLWLDSGIHAREWLSPATNMLMLKRFIDYQDADAQYIMDNYDMYFVPQMNPDGYTYSWTNDRYWRKNRSNNQGSTCAGVDLNRNYDYKWGGGGSSGNACSSTYRGTSAHSEPETQAVVDYVNGIVSGPGGANMVSFLTIHTYGYYWLVPFGDCTYPSNWDDTMTVAEATADAMEEQNGDTWTRGNSCEILYETTGTTGDWAQDSANVPYAYTPELRGNDFVVPTSDIAISEREVWAGITTMIATIESI